MLDAYNLSYAVLLLSGGLVADLYGRRRVFQAGAALLGLASLACALAPTIGVLVASRVAAGIGARAPARFASGDRSVGLAGAGRGDTRLAFGQAATGLPSPSVPQSEGC